MSSLKVSVAQVNVRLGALEHNLAVHQDYIQQAAAMGTELLLANNE